MTRFTRQIRLVDVGEAGQARLAAARVATTDALEATYLRAAGVTVVEAPRAVPMPELGLRNAAPRAVAESAYRALVAMREALGIGAS